MLARLRKPRHNNPRYGKPQHTKRGHSLRAAWAPSLIRRAARHRLVWTTAASVLVIGGVMGVSSGVAAIESERAQWGETAHAAVVVDAVMPGELIADAVALQQLPVAMIPATALASIPQTGRAKVALYPGEVVVSARVTASAHTQLPTNTVALTVSVTTRLPLLNQGDLVDLYTVDSANFSSRRVARNAVALVIEDKSVTVAIRQSEIAEATVAALRPVTVVLIG